MLNVSFKKQEIIEQIRDFLFSEASRYTDDALKCEKFIILQQILNPFEFNVLF